MSNERKNCNAKYGYYFSTENYYQHLSNNLYTDGVKDVAENDGVYWFIDVCMSYNNLKFRQQNEFQVWHLKRVVGEKFLVECSDGNENILITQEIPFSDFQDDDLKFWFVNGVLLLPSEY